MPQKLVLAASFGARLLADAIDKDSETFPDEPVPCGICGLACAPLANKPCGHVACENCWEGWARVQFPICRADGRLRAQCLQPGCLEAVHTSLWQMLVTQTEDVLGCIGAAHAADGEMKRLEEFAQVTRLDAAPIHAGPVCPICQESCVALLCGRCPSLANDGSGHVACEFCWLRWIEEQLERCRSQRILNIHCIGCMELADRRLWNHACTLSPAVQEVDDMFKHRLRLQGSTLFPAVMQIDCPQSRCVGLGYLGYDTVMCFLCEHQWAPEDKVGERPPDPDVEIVMGVAVKRCPKCSQYIEKNGGCDHMKCQHRGCGYEFWWSTLKPYELRHF